MELLHDIRTIYHLAITRQRGSTHKERLDNFYRGQAQDYDSFRRRLLHGRTELVAALEDLIEPGQTWIDMGAGTGSNLELSTELRRRFSSIYLVDLASPLIELARKRAKIRGWDNVFCVEADAAQFKPPRGLAQLITFSYSLTMIPSWRKILQHAAEILAPGGLIGVTDFYVSRAEPGPGFVRHSWSERRLWPAWFGLDGVHFDQEHLPFLLENFEPVVLKERRGKVPYLFGLKAPYFVFAGRKPIA